MNCFENCAQGENSLIGLNIINDLKMNVQSFLVSADLDFQHEPDVAGVPMRRPNDNEWVTVLSRQGFVKNVFHVQGTNERYFVEIERCARIKNYLKTEIFHMAFSEHSGLFFWPIKVSKIGTFLDSWNISALEAADVAKTNWVKIKSNMKNKKYEYKVSNESKAGIFCIDYNLEEFILKFVKHHTKTEREIKNFVELYPKKKKNYG